MCAGQEKLGGREGVLRRWTSQEAMTQLADAVKVIHTHTHTHPLSYCRKTEETHCNGNYFMLRFLTGFEAIFILIKKKK